MRRILLLLPYAIKHPGVTLDELAAKFGVTKDDLIDDLNLVFMCGLPGYGPGDLIDVSIEDDRVHVRMADYFGAPLRLTPAEALVLYAGAAALTELPEMDEADALRRALAKLGRALGIGAGSGTGIDVRLESGPPSHLRTVQRALQESRRIRIRYFSASSAELTERDVDPWGLVAALGRWYLVGLDHRSGEERMFRLDRVKQASLLEERATIPEDFDPGSYKGGFSGRPGAPTLSLEISPSAARWFTEYYPVVASHELPDRWHAVSLEVSGERWAASLLVRLGAQVRDVQPESYLIAARRLAQSIAAKHAS